MLSQGLHNVFRQTRHFFGCVRGVSRSALGPGPGSGLGLASVPGGASSNMVEIFPDVAEAILNKKPVVALESTIITHGMPYPENLKMATEVGRIVREHGALPATVAVMNGKICVGLSGEHLEQLTHSAQEAVKTSRRDLPYILSQGLTGGTTVSATMIAADKAGIPVFVTGGIGGVHRGAQSTFDVSADLTELGRTPVAVICSGAKSILDIELTLEYLETQGVAVATFGNTKDFPAFFSSRSGHQSPYAVSTPEMAAKMIDASLSLGLRSGMVIAVPIPEHHAARGAKVEESIQQALQEANQSGIKGKETTPFLLQRVNELTKGQSLQSNIALVRNNAKIGSLIAVELCRIRQQREKRVVSSKARGLPGSVASNNDSASDDGKTRKPVVIGGANVDFIATAEKIVPEASNAGQVRMSFGGVGRNLAECLARLGMKPLFVSAVGSDPLGSMMLRHCEEARMASRGIFTSKSRQTATYSAILSERGDFHVAVGDMDIHQIITPHHISGFEEPIKHAPLVIVDSNISEEALNYAINMCGQHKIPVWFEPTCMTKADKPFSSEAWHHITYMSPNVKELRVISNTVTLQQKGKPNPAFTKTAKEQDAEERPIDDIIEECLWLCQPLMSHIHCIVVTLGKNGVLICRNTDADLPFPTAQSLSHAHAQQDSLVSARYFPATDKDDDVDVINVTGAGDSLAAAMASFIINGQPADACVRAGILAAHYSLKSCDAISPAINPENFIYDNVKVWIPWEAREIDVSVVR